MEALMRRLWLVRFVAVAVFLFAAGSSSAATGPFALQARTCRTRMSNGVCGPYTYARITNSNGYNTYTGQDMWAANSGTTQTLTSTDMGVYRSGCASGVGC
jgi:hypothetical protein